MKVEDYILGFGRTNPEGFSTAWESDNAGCERVRLAPLLVGGSQRRCNILELRSVQTVVELRNG